MNKIRLTFIPYKTLLEVRNQMGSGQDFGTKKELHSLLKNLDPINYDTFLTFTIQK